MTRATPGMASFTGIKKFGQWQIQRTPVFSTRQINYSGSRLFFQPTDYKLAVSSKFEFSTNWLSSSATLTFVHVKFVMLQTSFTLIWAALSARPSVVFLIWPWFKITRQYSRVLKPSIKTRCVALLRRKF